MRGAVEAGGISAACGAALLLLFTAATGLAILLFALDGLAAAVAALFDGTFGLAVERDVFAALRAGALVLAFFIASLRLTEFSDKGNPPLKASWFLHRILVDEAFDRSAVPAFCPTMRAEFREPRKSGSAESDGTRSPRSRD